MCGLIGAVGNSSITDETVDKVETVCLARTMQAEAQAIATRSGELISLVEELVANLVGSDPQPQESDAPAEKASLEPGLIGLTRAHLIVIGRNFDSIISELQRL